jgi:hypothetical protein
LQQLFPGLLFAENGIIHEAQASCSRWDGHRFQDMALIADLLLKEEARK